MTYTLRPLGTKDVFAMSRILKAMKLSVMDIKFDDTTTQTQAGIEIMKMAFENLHLAEDEVSSFIANLAGITKEEFLQLPLEDGLSLVMQLKDQKGFTNFLDSAAKLTK